METRTTHSCAVPGCKNLNKKPMFTFPNPQRNLARFQKWVRAVQNPRYMGLTASQIHRRGYVCFTHFTSEDFRDSRTMKRLNCNAVPTLNLPGAKCGIQELLTPEPSNTDNPADLPAEFSEDPSNRQSIKEPEILLESFSLYDGKPLEDSPDDPEMLLRGAMFRDSNVSDFPSAEPGQSDCCPITDEYIYLESSIEPDQSSVVSEVVSMQRKNVNSESVLELDHNYFLPVHEEDVGFENSSNDDCFDRELVSDRGSENVENQCTLNDYSDISEKPASQKVAEKLSGEELEKENQCRINVYSDISVKLVSQEVTEQLSAEEVLPIETKKPYFKSVKSFLQDCNRMTEVCRICFQSLEEEDVIKLYEESSHQDTTQIKAMLKLVLPDLDLDIYPNTVICVKCVELLVYSYQLKEKWLSTEEKLQKIIEKKKGVINRDADLVIIGKRVITKAETEIDHKKHTGNPQSEEQSESELANALLQSLGAESNGKCLSENVSIFHGSIDANNFAPIKQFKDKPVRQRVVKSPELGPSMCDQCGRMYPNKTNLLRHQKTHNKPPKISSKERTKMCDVCGKLYATERCLKLHKRSHLDKKCSFCDRVFQNSGQLCFHVSSKHKRTTYQCHLCGKQYPYRTSLKVHLRKHDPANRNKTCHICNKKFFSMPILRKHIHSHVTERSLKCEFCGKFLKHRLSLQKHINIWHLNQAEHVCEFCNKPYWKEYDLKKHRLRHHKELHAKPKDGEGSNEENSGVNTLSYKKSGALTQTELLHTLIDK